jgi:hypothetical protein
VRVESFEAALERRKHSSARKRAEASKRGLTALASG